MDSKGILYLVATPIGNLEDITLRAIRTLKEVDFIAAEDTRHTIKLLNHFEIKKSLVSYYEHNKREKGNYLISQLLEGKNIALVSDAGTPGISDPGEDLVKLCIEKDIKVTPIPGPVAAVTGLIASGLPSGRFAFEGFLPMNKRSRKERLASLKNEVRTIVFYEAPHKLTNTLNDLYQTFGNRKVVFARELTKRFEEIVRCELKEAIEKYEKQAPKGEFVIIVEGISEDEITENNKKVWGNMSLEEHLDFYMREGLDKKEAMKKVAEDRGISKREVYRALL
ncbi:MAG: 16S rRNA (cytidine(1402)-2'-O)-methyltransferase [Clostridiaceae bacterium]|nr:16S rRNA (cytidine(1402)-2'-O)-methyltransferase [Clostridiaceae bacterium]